MPDTDAWTTRRLLQWTTQHFEKHRLDAPRVRAEMLLAHVLNVPRLRLYMDPDRPADPAERDRLRDLVRRAVAHEPVDYLTGQAAFFAMDFAVSPAVLIPRPSTETLVEFVMQRFRQHHDPLRFADLGTGSGAIAVTVLKHLSHATAVATDLSHDALDVARKNAAAHGVADRITFRHGDALAPLQGDEPFHALLSNPPYIPDDQWPDVPPDVKHHEPVLALRGGADGLDVLRPLIAGAKNLLRPQGLIAFEIAAVQADAVQQLAADAGLQNPTVLPDHERLPRVLIAHA